MTPAQAFLLGFATSTGTLAIYGSVSVLLWWKAERKGRRK